jgi:hypothetical protein
MAFVGSQVERLASGLSRGIAEKVEEIRESYREGRVREVYIHLQKLREEEHWDVLIKAKFLIKNPLLPILVY